MSACRGDGSVNQALMNEIATLTKLLNTTQRVPQVRVPRPPTPLETHRFPTSHKTFKRETMSFTHRPPVTRFVPPMSQPKLNPRFRITAKHVSSGGPNRYKIDRRLTSLANTDSILSKSLGNDKKGTKRYYDLQPTPGECVSIVVPRNSARQSTSGSETCVPATESEFTTDKSEDSSEDKVSLPVPDPDPRRERLMGKIALLKRRFGHLNNSRNGNVIPAPDFLPLNK